MDDKYAKLRAALAAGPVPGPWQVQDGCSWRRIGTERGDGDVLRPVVNDTDNWPDLAALRETLEYIAAANPEIIRALLSECDRLREQLEWTQHYALDTLKTASRDMDDWKGDMMHIANSAAATLTPQEQS